MALTLDGTTGISASGNITGAYIFGNASGLSGISSNKIFNGTSEANIGTSSGNANISIGGTSNVAVFTTTGVIITGDLSVSGNAILSGNILGDRVVNGTTSFEIQTANGNANITIGGTSNVAVFTTSGLNITGVSSASGNVTGGNVLTAGSISATGNITGGNILTGGTISAVGDINTAGNARALNFNSASADLAEKYLADDNYPIGTLLRFGGCLEVSATIDYHDTRVAGTVSDKPAYTMNSDLTGEHVTVVALLGRVPCRVVGTIQKGDLLVAGEIHGVATVLDPDLWTPGCVFGKALEDYNSNQEGVIEVVVGKF